MHTRIAHKNKRQSQIKWLAYLLLNRVIFPPMDHPKTHTNCAWILRRTDVPYPTGRRLMIQDCGPLEMEQTPCTTTSPENTDHTQVTGPGGVVIPGNHSHPLLVQTFISSPSLRSVGPQPPRGSAWVPANSP